MEIHSRILRLSKDIAMSRIKGSAEPACVDKIRKKIQSISNWDSLPDDEKIRIVEEKLKEENAPFTK